MDKDKLPGVNSSSLNDLLEAAKRVPTLSVTKVDFDRMTGSLEYHAATIAATKALAGVNEQKEMLKRVTGGLVDHSTAIRATEMLKSIGEQQKMIDRHTGGMNLQATIATSQRYLADIASQQEILERFTSIAKTPAYLDAIKGLGAYAMSNDAMGRLTGNASIAKIAEQFMARTSDAERYADAISDMLKVTSLGSYTEKYLSQVSGSSISSLVQADYAKLVAGSSLSQIVKDIERHAAYAARPALVRMGHLLHTGDAFSSLAAKTFRETLGDWREPVVRPADYFQAEVATQIYADRGFDAGLIEAPESVFYDELEDAGLDSASLDIELYGPLIVPKSESLYTKMQRNTACYQRFFQLETRLRQFIAAAMMDHFGPQWIKQGRIPDDVCEALKLVKQKNGVKDGDDDLEHTDFTHYEKIICRKDLWKDIFSVRFKTNRSEDIRESFFRLKFVRDKTMHSKSVSKEDLLTTIAEGRRLLSAIGWPNMR